MCVCDVVVVVIAVLVVGYLISYVDIGSRVYINDKSYSVQYNV